MSDNQVTLTADDIAALKLADTVTFHFYAGEGYVRAHLRNTLQERIFTAHEQRVFPVSDHDRERRIAVQTTMFGYGDDMHGNGGWRLNTEPKAAAFASISACSAIWQTIASLLRLQAFLCVESSEILLSGRSVELWASLRCPSHPRRHPVVAPCPQAPRPPQCSARLPPRAARIIRQWSTCRSSTTARSSKSKGWTVCGRYEVGSTFP